ncbi:MAG: OmpA family protein [Myxococcales bacterium]
MSFAGQQDMPETVPDNPYAEQRKSSRAMMGLTALLVATAGALGYLAFDAQGQRDRADNELRATKAQLVTLEKAEHDSSERFRVLAKDNDERGSALELANTKLADLNTEVAALRTQLDELSEEREAAQEQLAEFKAMTAQLKRMIDSGKLQVTFRRGRMIVELPAQVLFPSGSADLTDQGKESLVEVAKILRGMRDRRFIVAGHTDNVPVTGDRFKSNWELSATRAVNVTEALVKGGLRPEQLVAAGYSEYDPVARNGNDQGKQKNRRIEIILEPRLKAIPGLDKIAKK